MGEVFTALAEKPPPEWLWIQVANPDWDGGPYRPNAVEVITRFTWRGMSYGTRSTYSALEMGVGRKVQGLIGVAIRKRQSLIAEGRQC